MRVELECPVRSVARERLLGLLRVTMQLLGKTQGWEIRVMRRDGLAGGGALSPGSYFQVPEFPGDASLVITGIRNPEFSGRDG